MTKEMDLGFICGKIHLKYILVFGKKESKMDMEKYILHLKKKAFFGIKERKIKLSIIMKI